MDSALRAVWARRLYTRVPLVGGWLRRAAVRALAADDTPESVRALAEAVARTDDHEMRIFALESLEEVTRPRCIDAVCAVWAETRHPLLEALLSVHGWGERAPPEVRVLFLLAVRREAVLEGAGAETVGPLLSACRDPDPAVAERARAVLGRLSEPEAREALCAAALDGDELACAIAVANGYAPQAPPRRAVFYFLAEQWEAYEALDFDGRLLRAEYEATDGPLRRRVAARARAAGRIEWIDAALGDRRRRLAEMSADEWQTALDVLASQRRWGELWELAQEAPPAWSARLLQRLPPEEVAAAGLARLAAAWQDPHLGSLLRPAFVADAEAVVVGVALSRDGSALAAVRAGAGVPELWRLPGGAASTLAAEPSRPDGAEPLAASVAPLAVTIVPGLRDLAFSPRGRRLFGCGSGGGLWQWSLPEGDCHHEPGYSADRVNCIAVAARGPLLATGSGYHDGSKKEAGRVTLWELQDLRLRKVLRRHGRGVTCLAWSDDGRLLASGGDDGKVCLWCAPEGELRHVLNGGGVLQSVAFRPGGGLLAGLGESSAHFWELPEGKEVSPPWGAGAVTALAFSPDGTRVAAAGRDQLVRLWSLDGGRELFALAGHVGPVRCLAFSPDGRVLASGGDDRSVELWDTHNGRPLRTLKGFPAPVKRLAVSGNGETLVAVAGGRVEVWAAELVRLSRIPAAKITPADIALVQAALADESLSADERSALDFIAALARWRKRFDVHLDEAPRRIAVGEFDIEIAG